MALEQQILEMGVAAKAASHEMARASAKQKNRFLHELAKALEQNSEDILAANAMDLSLAAANGMDAARLDRLRLAPKNINSLAVACRHIAELPDPVGATETQWQRPNGLLVGKMRIPLGVICMIYEARPGVAIDAAILALKSGNAIILRGGKEAANSNKALAKLLSLALEKSGLPATAAQLVDSPDRAAVELLCRLDAYIDLMIPRGGESLIRAVVDAARMPVLMHYKGVCHAYIDKGADLGQALNIVENSKTQRPGVCNALECLLVHEDEAAAFLPTLAQRLNSHNVQFRADKAALPLLGPNAIAMEPDDLGREFLAQILAVVVVPDMDAALSHIAKYGSNHTEIICTKDYGRAMRFLREADASMVAVNASTRFNDGGELGLGAEIGISTTKIHAYGPMGLAGLTTTKFVVLGNGQIRE